MLWIYLIVLQIFFFLGLLYFFRSVLTRNITKATGHLQELGQDYVSKEEAANKFMQLAQKEAKNIAAKEMKVGKEAREKLIAEGQQLREEIIKDAHTKSEEITEKAQRNAEFLQNEMEQRINERAKELTVDLIQKSIPQDFLEDVHLHAVEALNKEDFKLKHLKLPENINSVDVISAFSLTEGQQESLKKKLVEKVGNEVVLNIEVNSSLITGLIIRIGSVVIDASQKYRIQKIMEEGK